MGVHHLLSFSQRTNLLGVWTALFQPLTGGTIPLPGLVLALALALVVVMVLRNCLRMITSQLIRNQSEYLFLFPPMIHLACAFFLFSCVTWGGGVGCSLSKADRHLRFEASDIVVCKVGAIPCTHHHWGKSSYLLDIQTKCFSLPTRCRYCHYVLCCNKIRTGKCQAWPKLQKNASQGLSKGSLHLHTSA